MSGVLKDGVTESSARPSDTTLLLPQQFNRTSRLIVIPLIASCFLWMLSSVVASRQVAAQELPQPPALGSSKWGSDDQRDAAKLITPEKVLEAIRFIRSGRMISLGRIYEEPMPQVGGRSY